MFHTWENVHVMFYVYYVGRYTVNNTIMSSTIVVFNICHVIEHIAAAVMELGRLN